MSLSSALSLPLLRLGTRESTLAMVQTQGVAQGLQQAFPELELLLRPQLTYGDKHLQAPMSQLGGNYGIFVKELEQGLLCGDTDLAVHSLKDMPSVLPEGLALLVIGPREDPRDGWLCPTGVSFFEAPAGFRVGTASRRRVAMLRRLRPDLTYVPIRGNLQTRWQKLTEKNEVDALVLAAAGCHRLGWQGRIHSCFHPQTQLIPAAGQGLLALEYRQADEAVLLPMLKRAFTWQPWHVLAEAERYIMRRLEGGCQLPLGIYASILEEEGKAKSYRLQAQLLNEQGDKAVSASCEFEHLHQALEEAEGLVETLFSKPLTAEIKASLAKQV
jgi:hydroxymethylbilane synthase